MDCRSLYDLWCEKVTAPELQADLKAMDESGDEAVIEDAFYRTLEFGTAGLRGVLGAGTNRMNIHTVGQATQGIADFINGQANDGEPGTVAICYDSRINSQLFAHTAASVLAAMASNHMCIRVSAHARVVIRYTLFGLCYRH